MKENKMELQGIKTISCKYDKIKSYSYNAFEYENEKFYCLVMVLEKKGREITVCLESPNLIKTIDEFFLKKEILYIPGSLNSFHR